MGSSSTVNFEPQTPPARRRAPSRPRIRRPGEQDMRERCFICSKEQKIFEGFDYVSNKVFEEELTKAYNTQHSTADAFGGLAIS